MKEFFENTLLVNIVSFGLGLLGIVASIFFYYKSLRKKDPQFSKKTISLIKDQIGKINGLEIKYQNDTIQNLSISKIVFYNNGRETIKTTDIAISNPIRVEVGGDYKVLDASILFSKNDANNFSIQVDSNCVTINFDYCDYSEGAVFQIIHTGKSSDDISLKGSMHGVKMIYEKSFSKSFLLKIMRPTNRLIKWFFGRKWSMTFILFFLFFFPVIFFVIMLSAEEKDNLKFPRLIEAIFPVIILLFYWGLAITIIRNRTPKGFDAFHNGYLANKNENDF